MNRVEYALQCDIVTSKDFVLSKRYLVLTVSKDLRLLVVLIFTVITEIVKIYYMFSVHFYINIFLKAAHPAVLEQRAPLTLRVGVRSELLFKSSCAQ